MKLLYILAVTLAVTSVHARTTTRQQASVAPQITAANDKDAKHRAMTHTAFANAGRRAGVEIWRIEDFEPVPVPEKDFGKFYKGDSYIILKTSSDKRNNLSWDIHYWLGSGTSQDEAGAAAILTVGLDDKLGGAAIQHRETEGHESPQMQQYFKSIRYMDGGHASGFSHVTTNAGAEKRLFQIKGKRNVRVRQVEPTISSMNQGDCFILDVNQDILLYVGKKTKNVERLKAISVANQIRDQDHNGRGKVEIIDQYSSEADTEKFFRALGSGSKDVVPEDTAGGDDQAFERNEEQTVTLSEISDSSGKLKITPLPKPFKQEQLKPQECYILDTVSGSIYVWVGKQSTEQEKTEAMSKAQQYLSAKKYPSWVHVSRIPQGTEPAAFKQYFFTWRDVGMSHSRIVRSLSHDELFNSDDEVSDKRAKYIGKTGAAADFQPDQATGDHAIYEVQSASLLKELKKTEGYTKFYQNKCYVIKYRYTDGGQTKYIVYVWEGKATNKEEKRTAAAESVKLAESLNAFRVKVPEGEEPTHLLKIFNGKLLSVFPEDSNQELRLFRVHGTKVGEDIRAEEVPLSSEQLYPDDVFILLTPAKNVLWIGQASSSAEQTEAQSFIKVLAGEDATFETVQQGAEDSRFWEILGGSTIGAGEQWRDKVGKRAFAEARLHEIKFYGDNYLFPSLGRLTHQEDLMEDGVYIVDAGDVVYAWIGKETPELRSKAADRFAEAYLNLTDRRNVVFIIRQGSEPQVFLNLFEEWDPEMWMRNEIEGSR